MIVIGAAAMAIGALLCVLAGIGAVRFPSALARLHAATKSSSLGLVFMFIGAGLAAGSVSLVAFGVIVAAFLFVTAPVSGHMLGRAAWVTDEGGSQDEPDRMSVENAASADFSVARWLGLTLVWMVLWRDASPGTVLAGAILAAGVEGVRRSVAAPIRISPVRALTFLATYLASLGRANLRVAREVVSRESTVDERVVEVPIDVRTPQAALLTANSATFSPGTLVLDISGPDPVLVVHFLHGAELEDGIREIERLARLADRIFADRSHAS